MKVELHPNGWTVLVHDFDLRTATQDDIDIIGCWLSSNTCVVFRGQQDMTVQDEIAIAKMFGPPEAAVVEREGLTPEQIERNKNVSERYYVPGSENMIIRVTGEENHKGERGLLGDVHELEWHANRVECHDRNPLVWLRSIRGSKGSVTSWTNHIVAYNNLSDAMKKICSHLQVDYHYYQPYPDVHNLKDIMSDRMGEPDFFPPLVYTNESGHVGLYFSWMQIAKFIGPGMNEDRSFKLINQLKDHILGNEQHLYHHHWEEGDVVIAEQWLGVHKRYAFDHLDKRLLHRITTNFANVDFGKMERAKSLLLK